MNEKSSNAGTIAKMGSSEYIKVIPVDAQIAKQAVKATLEGLSAVLAAKAAVEQQEAAQIKLCRDAGASWEKIAREYGITRQAVFQKWSKRV